MITIERQSLMAEARPNSVATGVDVHAQHIEPLGDVFRCWAAGEDWHSDTRNAHRCDYCCLDIASTGLADARGGTLLGHRGSRIDIDEDLTGPQPARCLARDCFGLICSDGGEHNVRAAAGISRTGDLLQRPVAELRILRSVPRPEVPNATSKAVMTTSSRLAKSAAKRWPTSPKPMNAGKPSADAMKRSK